MRATDTSTWLWTPEIVWRLQETYQRTERDSCPMGIRKEKKERKEEKKRVPLIWGLKKGELTEEKESSYH